MPKVLLIIAVVFAVVYAGGMLWAAYETRDWGKYGDDPRSRTFVILLWWVLLIPFTVQ